MKKQPAKRYFKNCKLKWTESVYLGSGKYKFSSKQFEGVLIETTEGKKTIRFIESYGVWYEEREKRSKSLKFTGVEITLQEYEQIKRDWKFEAATCREEVEKERYNNHIDRKPKTTKHEKSKK